MKTTIVAGVAILCALAAAAGAYAQSALSPASVAGEINGRPDIYVWRDVQTGCSYIIVSTSTGVAITGQSWAETYGGNPRCS